MEKNIVKISFETAKKWKSTHLISLNADGTGEDMGTLVSGECTDLPENSIGAVLCDGENYLDGEHTSAYYHGGLNSHIEYRYNEKLGKYLTYIGTESMHTGRVDNFVLRDEKNFAHREDRSKKVSVFVPWHYDGSEKYDLLYMFDAQNLFCGAGKYTDKGDPYGSWQVDAVLDMLYRQTGRRIIAVGFDNSDEHRNEELFMDPAQFGELAPLAYAEPVEDFSHGYLDRTSDFLRNTLHPFIMEKYNVSEDNIGIGGSSMGGIASFWCALHQLGFYKYVITYSPAFALYGAESYDRYFESLDLSEKRELQPRIHIYCGEGDPLERMLCPLSREMKEHLVRYGYEADKIFETYDKEKTHNEESWRLLLPQSLDYLLN